MEETEDRRTLARCSSEEKESVMSKKQQKHLRLRKKATADSNPGKKEQAG
jgi:hypothetical protein